MSQHIFDTYEKLKGQLVLSFGKVYHLVGLAEDDMDYYWVLGDYNKFRWTTCVEGLIQLKGRIDQESYDRLLFNVRRNAYYAESNHWLKGNPELVAEMRSEFTPGPERGTILRGPEFDPV